MKKYFLQLFDIEEDEIESKRVLAAAGSLTAAIVIVFLPLYL